MMFSYRQQTMGDHTLLFNVGMTCGGCKGAVTRIVSKLDGVTSFDADVANQKLTIVGTVSKDVVRPIRSQSCR